MRLALIILAATALLAAGPIAASQFIAAVFDRQAALGAPLLAIGETRIYPPWAIFDWRGRWSRAYPKPFLVADLIALSGAAAAFVLLIAVASRRRLLKPFGKDAWANRADIAAAGLLAAEGTVVGKLGKDILAFDGPEHQLLIGASRSGKGRGQVVPTLLAWSGSALVFDVKGELDSGDARHGFPGTSGFRASLGPVLRFAPTSAQSNCFNPLFEVRKGANEVRDVQNIVEIIVDPAGEGRYQDFWDRSAKQLLTGLILHVLYSEPPARKTLAIVREKLRDLDHTAEEMRLTLHRLNPFTKQPEPHPEVLHAAHSYLAGEERLRSSVKATAESFFGIFADPIVAEKTASSDFRIGDLMCGKRPVTLYLQPPPSDAVRLVPLMRLIINQIARGLMEDQARDGEGREKHHRLLLLLDEFPMLGRMPFFETAMGAMAGYGMKCALVCQSLNHITRAYGRDNVIVDNCGLITAFAAADMETAKRIALMAGEIWEMRPQESEHRPRSLFGPRKGTLTYREERRPLLLPGEVRALPRDTELIFVTGARPLKAKKLRFDREPVFAERLRPPALRASPISQSHDWTQVAPLGRLPKEKRPVSSTNAALRAQRPTAQGELFKASEEASQTISEKALAGFRDAQGQPLPHPLSKGL